MNISSKIKIGFVEDQKLFREGIVAIINSVENFELLFAVENYIELQTHFLDDKIPDVLLLDMGLPGLNGIEINDIIHKNYPEIKTIIVSGYDQPRYIVKLIEEGANSFLSKNIESEELITAIKSVYSTGFYFNKVILNSIQNKPVVNKKNTSIVSNVVLSNREKEVLILICQQYSTDEIAEKLFISPRTVDGHRLNLLDKTQSKNLAGLVVYAIKDNIYIPL